LAIHRFFLVEPLPSVAVAGVPLALDEGDLHHLVDVLRLGRGDRVMAVGTDGRESRATLRTVSAAGVVADLDAPVVQPPRPRVSLAAALSRRERWELALQKATELGVAEVLPFVASRCVVRLEPRRAATRKERWKRIAQEAAKQSQRADAPAVHDPLTLEQLAAEAGRFDVVMVAWEEAGRTCAGIGSVLDAAGAGPDTSALVVVGPEGGLAEGEVALLEAAGGVVVTLGDSVLRTETAAIAAVTLAIYELGGLGGRGR
jgi:16S rRNA (uracil1498-N3)-methyltransferase